MDLTYILTSAASNMSPTWPLTLSSSTYTTPGTYYSGAPAMPAPRQQSALEWLDAEVEATCRLARQAG